MASVDGVDTTRGRGKNKRMWSSHEESILVDILEEMQDSVWKCDTGYKTGYLLHIEKTMVEKLPGCGMKAKPHIESKIKLLKRQMNFILDIQKSGSGFGWNDEEKMVVGEREVFMNWAKGREGAAALYNKPFPLFDRLCGIYAKDRATGEKARGPGEAEESNSIDVDDAMNEDSIVSSSKGERKGRKRKDEEVDRDGDIGGLSKFLSALVDAEKESTSVMRNLFSRDAEIDEKRDQVFSTLMGLGGLSSDEIMEATTTIGLDDWKVKLLFSMPDEFKIKFAKSLLHN